MFHASEFYPDTSYYAIEMRGRGSTCSINNIMYWDDGTEKGSPRLDGAFVKSDSPDNKLVINGGMVGAGGGMKDVYTPDASVHDVILKCSHPITEENFPRLMFNTDLPDYPVACGTNAAIKVADIFAMAEIGCCEGVFTLDDGAEWKISVTKAAGERVKIAISPCNTKCADYALKAIETGKHIAVVLDVSSGPGRDSCGTAPNGRFRTTMMDAFFRPIDHGFLRSRKGANRLVETGSTNTR